MSAGTQTAQATARMQLEFIRANLAALRPVDTTGKHETAAMGMIEEATEATELTPKQMSYIDGIYEMTMRGIGLPSIKQHVDKKRAGLRYGQANG